MIRHGLMTSPVFPSVIGIGGPPKVGKTRLVGSALRAAPEFFGEKGIYVEVDPDGGGSMLEPDACRWERVTLDTEGDFVEELRTIIKTDWRKEGFGTVFIDTGSIFCQNMLSAISAKQLFGNNINLGGVWQPTQGDYTGVDTSYFKILNLQNAMAKKFGTRFITTYHDLEIRPEAGQPGEVLGGPMGAGKAMTKKIVSWYNCYMRVAFEAKPRGGNLSAPIVYERKLYTQTNGIWQAGIRIKDVKNPHPSVVVGDDPADAWRSITSLYAKKEEANG